MNDYLMEKLIKKAKKAREEAFVPYSNFSLGAAVLTDEGEIYTGCNIENAAYGLTICAERTAIFKAVSEGHRDFQALLLVADTEKPVPPCGSCRQVISEFGDDITVIMTNFRGDIVELSSSELLPGAFSKGDLEDGV